MSRLMMTLPLVLFLSLVSYVQKTEIEEGQNNSLLHSQIYNKYRSDLAGEALAKVNGTLAHKRKKIKSHKE